MNLIRFDAFCYFSHGLEHFRRLKMFHFHSLTLARLICMNLELLLRAPTKAQTGCDNNHHLNKFTRRNVHKSWCERSFQIVAQRYAICMLTEQSWRLIVWHCSKCPQYSLITCSTLDVFSTIAFLIHIDN